MKATAHDNRPYYPSLPKGEVKIYFAIYLSVIVWSINSLLIVSKDNETKYLVDDDVETGWYNWIGRHKDVTDFEWEFWEKYFFITVTIGFSGHFIVARIADNYFTCYRFDIYCLYGFIFTVYFLGIYGVLFLLFHFSMQYVVAIVTKNVIPCWISGCTLAYSLTANVTISVLKSCYPTDEYKPYFVLFTAAMCNLRCISFSIEYVWSLELPGSSTKKLNSKPVKHIFNFFKSNRQTTDNTTAPMTFTFKDLLVYQMYYPLCYGGPVLKYNEFSSQIRKPPVLWNSCSVKTFALGIGRFLMWHIVLDLLLHWIYVSAIFGDYALVSRLPLFSLLGIGLAMVSFFCMKYICMYGLTSFFSSSDNLNVPGPPHCIFTKHRVTDMWKYFDKGLHTWLVRYIYIPLGGSRVTLWKFALNSTLPFAFVYVWHGSSQGQAYWAFLSWLGVCIECVSWRVYNIEHVKHVDSGYLSRAWSRRIRAVLSTPVMLLLLVSNLFYLCNFAIATLYCKRLLTESVSFMVFLFVFLYSGCQTCMELNMDA